MSCRRPAWILFLSVIFIMVKADNASRQAKDNTSNRWMVRFNTEASQKFLRTLDANFQDNILFFQDASNKKDAIGVAPRDSIIRTSARNFPMTNQTVQMMFALFGDDGLFSKDGFYRFGMISAQGPAQVVVSKVFANKTVLLDELRRSETAPIGTGVFSVLTQLLFLPEDIRPLEEWLTERIAHRDDGANDPCDPKVVINYKCCDETAEPTLVPEFGSIDMGID